MRRLFQKAGESDVLEGSLASDLPPAPKPPNDKSHGGANAPARGRKPSVKASMDTRIRTTLETMLGSVSALLTIAGEPAATDGAILARGSPAFIDSLINLAAEDKNVRTFLVGLTTGSAYANVVIAAAPIVIGILANHALIPPIFGLMAPPLDDGSNTNN